MKPNWQTKKLGEICEIVTGNTPKTSHKEYYGNDILWAGPSDLDQGIFVARTNKKLSKKGVDEGGARLVPKDSVLLSCIGNIGKIGIAVEDMTTNQQINTFVPNKDILDSKYLYYSLITKVDDFKNTSSQTTLPIINKTKCSNIGIPLPPLVTQQKIVTRLDELLGNIAQAKQLRQEAIADTEKILSQTLREIFEEGKEKGWEEKELEKVAKFIDYRGKTPNKTTEGMRLITAKNVKWGFLNVEPREYVNKSIYDSWMTRGIPMKGDVLFTTEAPLANVAQLDTDEKVVFAQRIIILQPDQKKLSQDFLKYTLMAGPIRDVIIEQGTGATVKGIKASKLKKVKILIPPLPEQLQIVTRLDTLAAKIRELRQLQAQQLEDLKKLKKAYLREAFSGELI